MTTSVPDVTAAQPQSVPLPLSPSPPTSSTASRNSYSPEPPMTPIAARSVLARSATAGQATFEPDEFDPDEDEEELEEDDPLEAVSPAFLSVLPDLSADDPAEEEASALELLSDFLLSDPFDEAVAGSQAFRPSPPYKPD